MTELTQEQLAEIRQRHEAIETVPSAATNQVHIDRRALLRHIDHQAARIAALEQRLGKLASARDEAIQRLTAIKSDGLKTEDAAYRVSHALMSLMLVGEGSPILEGDEA